MVIYLPYYPLASLRLSVRFFLTSSLCGRSSVSSVNSVVNKMYNSLRLGVRLFIRQVAHCSLG